MMIRIRPENPDDYPRFGFQTARPQGILCPYDAPDEAFPVCELVPGALEGVVGTVRFPPAFDDWLPAPG